MSAAADSVAALPPVRGRIEHRAPLKDLVWFRAGGPADVLFRPADADDLAAFLAALDPGVPVQVIGVGSNLIVRDGGLPGVTVRLGRGFTGVERMGATRIRAGAGALDALVAQKAAAWGIAGLEFLRGVPGTIGGALRMNAGCYGAETRDVLVSARAVDRAGRLHEVPADALAMTYRRSGAPEDWIFVDAVFEGRAGDPDSVRARMEDLVAKREAAQPVREKTGGSTFKNPDPGVSGGRSAWQLIDTAGCRGLVHGDAQVSELHCNFLINRGRASAAEIEALGEIVRARVEAACGVRLDWEIRRIGRPAGETP